MIINNKNRIGNFTSSRIEALTTLAKNGIDFGKPAITYIEEKNNERKLGRSLNQETTARPTTWGKYIESRVFNLLGLAYKLVSDQTIMHPTIDCWSGSPDIYKTENDKKIVADIKCPFTLNSFCGLVNPLVDCKGNGNEAIKLIRANHKDGEKYYWQLVSNAILIGADEAELIVYAPYFSELAEIKEDVANMGEEQNELAWIYFNRDEIFPYLVDDGYYKNINVIQFDIPKKDKEFLTERVLKAKLRLIE